MARSVLIVKLAAIGDVAMAMPMVTALRAEHPGTRISWLAGRTVAPLLRCVEGIEEVIEVDETALHAGRPWQRVAAGLAAWRRLGGRRFDLVLIAHSDPRYRRLVAPLRSARSRWLGEQSGTRGLPIGQLHSDAYVRLALGRPPAGPLVRPRVDATLTPTLAAWLAARNADDRPLVALTPGGARNVARDSPLRRWPLERYVELERRLHDAGCRAVLTGDAGDSWARTPFPDRVVDLIGRTDLPQLVALFRRCAAVVAHDSGPMHLARLAGTEVVALLGPTPPTMFFARDEPVRVLWPGRVLPCAPCYDGLEFAPCADNKCMQMITVDSVLERLVEVVPLRYRVGTRGGTPG